MGLAPTSATALNAKLWKFWIGKSGNVCHTALKRGEKFCAGSLPSEIDESRNPLN
jgi:hypothetical protein